MPDDPNLKSLELLFDYTKFHVGIYVSVGTALIAASTVLKQIDKDHQEPLLSLSKYLVGSSLVAILLAGACAGVILSTITRGHSVASTHEGEASSLVNKRKDAYKSAYDFCDDNVGIFKGITWQRFEHFFFWLSVMLILIAFALRNFA